MKRYRLILEGRNFIIDTGEGAKKVGFYATRFVKAHDLETAEKIAVELVNSDPSLKGNVLNEKTDPPIICLDEHCEIGWFEYIRRQPGVGFTFYPEDGTEEEAAC